MIQKFEYDELIAICFLFETVDKEYIKFGKHDRHVMVNEIKKYIHMAIHNKTYELNFDKRMFMELSNIVIDGINVSGSKNMFNLSEKGIKIYNKLVKEIFKNE